MVRAILDDEKWRTELLDKDSARFMSSAVLIDTVNFKEKMKGKKWNEVDSDVYKELEEISEGTANTELFTTLYQIKLDKDSNIALGWHLLARKDYKNYKMGDHYLGLSTVFLSIRLMAEEFGPENMKKDFEEMMDAKGLEVYGILTHYNNEAGDVKREMLLYSRDAELVKGLNQYMLDFEDLATEPIDIEGFSAEDNYYTY